MRFLYFFYPLILFNAWIIANCMLRNNYSISHANPIITIEILKCIFGIIVVDFFKKSKSEYHLGDVGWLLSQVLITMLIIIITRHKTIGDCKPVTAN